MTDGPGEEQNAGAKSRRERRVALDATLAFLAGGALMAVVGVTYREGYFGRMGMPRDLVGWAYEDLVREGFPTVILPVAGAIGLMVLMLAFEESAGLKRRADTLERFLAFLAATSMVGYAWIILGLNQTPITLGPLRIPFGADQARGALGACATAAIYAILVIRGQPRWMHRAFIESFPGKLLVVVIVVAALSASSAIRGGNTAGDQLWHLAPYRVIDVTTVEGNGTFFFVGHANGAYVVRDLSDVGGEHRSVLLLSEACVLAAQIRVVLPAEGAPAPGNATRLGNLCRASP